MLQCLAQCPKWDRHLPASHLKYLRGFRQRMISWPFSAPLYKLQQNPKCPSQNQCQMIQSCNQPLRIQSVIAEIHHEPVLLLLLLPLPLPLLHPHVLLQGQAFSKTTANCQASSSLAAIESRQSDIAQQRKQAREPQS